MALLVLPDPVLLLLEFLLHFAQLGLEEVGRDRGLLFARLQILLDVERREGVGHLGHLVRIPAAVAEGERHGPAAVPGPLDALQIERDIPAHPVEQRLRRDLSPRARVEIEALHQVVQLRTAHDLFADRVESHLDLLGHGRADERFGDLLSLDQDGRARFVDVRQGCDEAERGRERAEEYRGAEPAAPGPDVQRQMDPRTTLTFVHGASLRAVTRSRRRYNLDATPPIRESTEPTR